MYAFTQVAIYGKTYCQAAKDTWTLVKSRGVGTLFNHFNTFLIHF